jgi:PIN domain nuclease of toxin-antitoxin system
LKAILLDTHAWAWSLTAEQRLSRGAVDAITAAETVLLSPISFFEIAQKVRLGKWPEMTPFAARLPSLLETQGGALADLDGEICAAAGIMDWPHRDPFDRLLAATAKRRNLPIVSADAIFDGVVTRIL